MRLPINLHTQIVDFLTSLPTIGDEAGQQALLHRAGLDEVLISQISIGGPPEQFFQLLVPLLTTYGTLYDGRNALVAVLEAAKAYVGSDRRKACDSLIQELETIRASDKKFPKPSLSSRRKIIEFQEIPNPFIYGNPIQPEEADVFVGRLDIVERIKKLVTTDPKPTLFLYGRRRSGKTSTLLNLHRFLGKDVVCVFLDMQDARFRESSEAFCQNVSEAIVTKIPQLSKTWEQLNFTNNPFSAFAKFLDTLETIIVKQNLTILLTLDEYECIESEKKDILNTLRTMIQHRRKIIILIAGSHRFEDIKTVSWSSYLINTQTVEISWLDPYSAQDLLTKPVKGLVEYPEEMPSKILAITHRQPLLLQAVACELVNYLNLQKRNQAQDNDLETVIKTVLIRVDDGYFGNYWIDECTEQERDLLEKMVLEGKEYVNFTPANKILRSLLRKEILERQDNNNADRLHFAVPLFRRWIQEKQLMMNSQSKAH